MSKQINSYGVILTSGAISEANDLVRKFNSNVLNALKDGNTLQGGVSVQKDLNSITFSQAVIKIGEQ